MTIEHNMQYENFIRYVFNHVDRSGDPLRLANTDINTSADTTGELTSLRLGVAYSLGKLLERLEFELGDTGVNYSNIEGWIKEVMDSKVSYKRIHEILDLAFVFLKNNFK